LIKCIPAEDRDFEIGHFRNFQTSVTLTVDRVIRPIIVYHSPISAYTYQILFKSEKKLFVDGRTEGRTYMDTETDFTRSTRRGGEST